MIMYSRNLLEKSSRLQGGGRRNETVRGRGGSVAIPNAACFLSAFVHSN